MGKRLLESSIYCFLGDNPRWNTRHSSTNGYVASDHRICPHLNMLANLDWSDNLGTCANIDVTADFYSAGDGDLLK